MGRIMDYKGAIPFVILNHPNEGFTCMQSQDLGLPAHSLLPIALGLTQVDPQQPHHHCRYQ